MNIEIIINSRNDRGFVQAALMIGEESFAKNDCGTLWLSEEEFKTLANALQVGSTESNECTFTVTDQTLVQEY